ncbi:MAG: ABC transporter permease [Anaerolineae bacterium]
MSDNGGSSVTTGHLATRGDLMHDYVRPFLARPETGALLALMAMSLFLSLTTVQFLTVDNLLFVARAISYVAIAAMGACLVIITAGIDLSVGSVMGFCGVLTALLSVNYSVAVGLPVGIVAGAFIGLVNGAMISKLRLVPFMVTLGMLSVVRGLAYVTIGGWPVTGLPKLLRFLGQGFVAGVPVPIFFTFIFAIVLSWFLSRTSYGWYIYAVGGNEEATRLSGVPVDRVKMLVYTIAGLMGGIGGILLTARLAVGESTAAYGYELDVIAATVIGGTSLQGGEGSVVGVLLGAALMGVLRNGLVLLNVTAYWQQIVIGATIVVAILIDRLRR